MIGAELLDDPEADPALVQASLRDVARINRLFGGTRAVVEALEPFFRAAARTETGDGGRGRGMIRWTLLDVGTGLGDIPRAAATAARRHGVELTLVGVERIPAAARAARAGGKDLAVILADGSALPVRPRSVDVVIVSQVLHHLPRDVAVRWIAGCDRLARRAVVLADLRRARAAMAGIWLASLVLGFHRVTRHDAVVSLRRGYTLREFADLLSTAGVPATARKRPGFRLVAAWAPTGV